MRNVPTFVHFVPVISGTKDCRFFDSLKLPVNAFTVSNEPIAGKIDATIVAAASALCLKIPMVLHINFFSRVTKTFVWQF